MSVPYLFSANIRVFFFLIIEADIGYSIVHVNFLFILRLSLLSFTLSNTLIIQ